MCTDNTDNKKDPVVSAGAPVCVPSIQLTFDLQEHEFLVGHGAVVGRLFWDVDTSQVDAAEVLLAGETGQSHVGETRVFIHCSEQNLGRVGWGVDEIESKVIIQNNKSF